MNSVCSIFSQNPQPGANAGQPLHTPQPSGSAEQQVTPPGAVVHSSAPAQNVAPVAAQHVQPPAPAVQQSAQNIVPGAQPQLVLQNVDPNLVPGPAAPVHHIQPAPPVGNNPAATVDPGRPVVKFFGQYRTTDNPTQSDVGAGAAGGQPDPYAQPQTASKVSFRSLHSGPGQNM